MPIAAPKRMQRCPAEGWNSWRASCAGEIWFHLAIFQRLAHKEFAEAAKPRCAVFAVGLEQFAAWLPRTAPAVLSATSMHSAVTKQRCMRALHSTAKGFALLDPQSALATNHSIGDLIVALPPPRAPSLFRPTAISFDLDPIADPAFGTVSREKQHGLLFRTG